MAYTFIAMSVTVMLSLPVLERTHTHNSQILEANCEICLQLSAADNLLPEHFINEWPVTTRQFNVYQSDVAVHSILRRQQPRAPPGS